MSSTPAPAQGNQSSRDARRQQRRQQLISATMKCIARKGISGTTLADVAGAAGLSQGIVNLHFDSKDNLLRETLLALADDYRTQFERALERAPEDPAARLAALIDVDLRPSVCQPAKLAVWFAFWGEVKARPTYRKICDDLDRYYDSVVEALCRDIIADGGYRETDASLVAMTLASMTSGLWLSCLIGPHNWDRHTARRAVTSYLAGIFPNHFDREVAA